MPPWPCPPRGQLPALAGAADAVRGGGAVHPAGAAGASPTSRVTDATAPAVAEICARLDGLPLAIELAAARVKLLPPPALLARLEHRLAVLTGGARDLPARQQTLRAPSTGATTCSTPAEQALFARLAVFAGGCTLEAVEACAAQRRGRAGRCDVLDGLGSLVDKSLLRQEEARRAGSRASACWRRSASMHRSGWRRAGRSAPCGGRMPTTSCAWPRRRTRSSRRRADRLVQTAGGGARQCPGGPGLEPGGCRVCFAGLRLAGGTLVVLVGTRLCGASSAPGSRLPSPVGLRKAGPRAGAGSAGSGTHRLESRRLCSGRGGTGGGLRPGAPAGRPAHAGSGAALPGPVRAWAGRHRRQPGGVGDERRPGPRGRRRLGGRRVPAFPGRLRLPGGRPGRGLRALYRRSWRSVARWATRSAWGMPSTGSATWPTSRPITRGRPA